MADLMVISEQYRWDKVRSLYHEVLTLIQQGRRSWTACVKDLKDEMLRSSDLIPLGNNFVKNMNHGSNNNSQPSVCRNWNFSKNGCPRGESCQYRHICNECSRVGSYLDNHTAKDCSRQQTDNVQPGDNHDNGGEVIYNGFTVDRYYLHIFSHCSSPLSAFKFLVVGTFVIPSLNFRKF